MNPQEIEQIIAGIIGAGFLVGLGIFLLVLVLAVYVYTSFAWMTIAQKLKYKKAWLAWIPIANGAMILQLGGFHWAWIFLVLIPILGWIPLVILIIIANWRIFEKRNYPGWFSLARLIPRVGGILILVVLGFVAWAERKKPLL